MQAVVQPASRSFEGPQFAPFPDYAQTDEQRDRWYLCAAIVSAMSAQFEPSGRPDARFVWVATRALYKSDTPTGEIDEETRAALPGDWHGPAMAALGVSPAE
jgi:hypothetical protein